MAAKEAKARIKISNLLDKSGWCFFDDMDGKANVVQLSKVMMTMHQVDGLSKNSEIITSPPYKKFRLSFQHEA